MENSLSKHANARFQQRSIPPFMVELLEKFGTSKRGIGCEKLYFDKNGRKKIKAYVGGDRFLKSIEKWLRVYLVVSDDGSIITVGHMSSRVHSKK